MPYSYEQLITAIKYNEECITRLDLLDHIDGEFVDADLFRRIIGALKHNYNVTEITLDEQVIFL